MEKMSIHRALSELKLIGARIEKMLLDIIPAGIAQNDKLVNGQHLRKDFEADAKSKYQAISDLIKRRQTIKSKIILSNATTFIEIGNKRIVVADAIDMKSIIQHKKKIVEVLKKWNASAKKNLEQHNVEVNKNVLMLAGATLQKENVKIGDDDVMQATEAYRKANEFHFVDPLNIDKEINDLEKEIAEFEADVDAKLSESNAITTIEF